LQWAAWFSRRREGKEGGREKPLTGAPPQAASHTRLTTVLGVARRIERRIGRRRSMLFYRRTQHPLVGACLA